MDQPQFAMIVGTFAGAGQDAVDLLTAASQCEWIFTSVSSSFEASKVPAENSAVTATVLSTMPQLWLAAFDDMNTKLVAFVPGGDPVRQIVFDTVDVWISGSVLPVLPLLPGM